MVLELSRKRAVAALTGAALSCVAPTVLGADCDTLGLPNPIWGAGGSAETQTIGAVAAYLAGLPDHPITIFWWDPGACQGYQAYLNDAITNTSVKYWAPGATAASTCSATAHPADFSHMGNDHSFCVKGGLTTPSGYPDGYGTIVAPVQTLNIIVDKDSSQKSISAEALYYIFGFGAGASGKSVEPWTNPVHIVTRNPTSFASQMLADAVFGDSTRAVYDDPGQNNAGPGPNGRLGFRGPTQNDVIAAIDNFGNTNAESPIGYVSGSAVIGDEQKGRKTKVLAYQAQDQTCGFWPDLTESTKDKLNVRTGKYALWAPGRFYYKTDGGDFANADVKTFVEAFVGQHDIEVLNRVIDNGDVPLCAMQVNREGLSGAISSVAPDDPCGCYFESRTAGTAQCDSCREGHDEDCSESGAVCRRGFCEAY
jgi:hypothetical protein